MNHSPAAQAALKFTKYVTERWPDRLTGRPACLECGDYLKTEFNKFCDRTAIESFDVHPGAFLGYLKINVALYITVLICLWIGYFIPAMILSIISTIITLAEFMYYKEFLDPFYKKRIGKNVYGVIEPKGEVKQQVIVSAHHDSAHVFNFLENNAKWYVPRILSAILFQNLMLIGTIIIVIGVMMGSSMSGFVSVALVVLSFGALCVGQLWFFIQDKGTPGAGDNMICTAVSVEIGKHLFADKTNQKPLNHTRVIIASWDSEECGLRGARAYVKAHYDELHSIKTYNYNLESLYDYNSLTFLNSDLNGLVPLSMDMVKECVLVADQCGYNVKTAPFPMLAGGTDSAEMAKAGIESTCLSGMSLDGYGEVPAYHTTRDTIDAVDLQAVEAAIEIGLAYIKRKDSRL